MCPQFICYTLKIASIFVDKEFPLLRRYIEWASREPEKGTYEFSGMYNFTDFVLKAQQEGLMVIMRTGPFIDAERDMVRMHREFRFTWWKTNVHN
jgi:beta-galactosidase GanA